MKTYECVYTRANNENSDSAMRLLCLRQDFTGDLREQVRCCLNWDDNRLVEVDKYRVITVKLPDWLPFDSYKSNQFEWEIVLRVLKGHKMDIDTVSFEKADILRQAGSVIDTLATVLFGNLRSEFRKSLRAQVENWIATPVGERKYGFPLSKRQLAVLVDRHSRYDPANAMYQHTRYNEMTGCDE